MEVSLQKQIIRLLHYALNPGGVLFLGTAETLGEFTDLFEVIDSKWRIYRRKEDVAGGFVDYPAKRTFHDLPQTSSGTPLIIPKPADLQGLVERTVLDQFAPAAVLINDRYEILHFVGRTEKYLVPPTGKPSFNVLNMARADLKFELTAALHLAGRKKKPITRKGIRIRYNGDIRFVDLSISPFTHKELPPGLFLIIFEDKTCDHAADDLPLRASTAKNKGSGDQGSSDMDGSDPRRLEQELQSTREYLQAIIEELETSNEELKSTNEELQSVNEELQSTNEELETSKEELQSTNEELNTVNTELQNKVHELSMVGDDMNNLLAATDIASIFLNVRFCIKRYTPAAARIIKLIPTDIGRPLSDLKTSFPGVDLCRKTQQVMDNLNTFETKIMSEDHAWYQLKVMPYRTTDNVIDGVVITLMNIQQQIGQNEDNIRRFAVMLEDTNDAVTVQDFEGRILAWNKGAEKMYGWTEAEALKMNLAELLPEDRHDEFRTICDQIERGESVPSFKTRRKTRNGHILDVWMTVTALKDESGRPFEVATTERDLAWLSEKS